MDLFRIKYHDETQRTISYTQNCGTQPFYYTTESRESFEYVGPEHIEVTPHLIAWLNNKFSSYFNTNPFLWAISVSTCPEELRPYLILPDEQLTYKGIN